MPAKKTTSKSKSAKSVAKKTSKRKASAKPKAAKKTARKKVVKKTVAKKKPVAKKRGVKKNSKKNIPVRIEKETVMSELPHVDLDFTVEDLERVLTQHTEEEKKIILHSSRFTFYLGMLMGMLLLSSALIFSFALAMYKTNDVYISHLIQDLGRYVVSYLN